MAGAAVFQPAGEMPQTGGSGDSPAVMAVTSPIPECQRKRSKAVSKWAMAMAVNTFATLRPEAPNTFTGKPAELEDWLEAVHIYLALY
jgi:hypothetical protein